MNAGQPACAPSDRANGQWADSVYRQGNTSGVDRSCASRASSRLEPDEGKLSRPVLRGGSGSNAAPLPDKNRGVSGRFQRCERDTRPWSRFDWPALLVPHSQASQSDGLDQSPAQHPSPVTASLPSPDVNDNVLRLRSAFRFGPCVQLVSQPRSHGRRGHNEVPQFARLRTGHSRDRDQPVSAM
jgi:hypothetical protein